jgi:transposase
VKTDTRNKQEKQSMEARAQNATPVLTTIGVEIGKDVFHIVGFGADGKIALRRKIKRLALSDTFKKLPSCIVGMEACLSAHFVSRMLRMLGHEPRIIPAIYVKPFVKWQKNERLQRRRSNRQGVRAAELTHLLREDTGSTRPARAANGSQITDQDDQK